MIRWVRNKFPELEFRPTFFMLGCVVPLVLLMYHGKPKHYYKYFGGDPANQNDAFYSYLYSHLFSFVVLMLIPLVLVKLVLRDDIRDYGLRIVGAKKEFLIALALFALILPILLYFGTTDSFQAKYPKLKAIENNAELFVLYEAAYLIKWISWEFFFRGFLLFGFRKKFGEHAILISTIPFVLMHAGKPEVEVFGAILAGFILCRLALNGRSIYPGVLLHFLVAGAIDFITSSWWK